MILHLVHGGQEPIELHIHDGATVSISPDATGQKPQATNYMGGTRPVPRLVTLALVGVFGMAIGNTFLPRLGGSPSRVPALAPPALATTQAVPEPLPRADPPPQRLALPSDVPPAITRQLAQPPIVMPAPAQARAPAGGGAFGLEN